MFNRETPSVSVVSVVHQSSFEVEERGKFANRIVTKTAKVVLTFLQTRK